jgi:integral membrane protein (TIGR01906 family)
MKRILAFIAGWCLLITSLIFAIETTAFQKSFYASFYENSNLEQSLQVSLEDIEKSMNLMLDYLQDQRDDLDGTITRAGIEKEVYNEKEKLHMQDVKALYKHAKMAGYIALGLLIVLGSYLLIHYKKEGLRLLAAGILEAAGCFLILLAFIGLWAATDFTDFWTHFHQLFFDNDLWLLDPATDFMICICPEEMFYQLVFKIIFRFLLIYLPFVLLALFFHPYLRAHLQAKRALKK